MEQYPRDEAGQRAKAETNAAMFDRAARRYDLLNRVMSLGLDARWRRRLVDLCAVGPGGRALDLCTGTGDVARELASRGATVVGLDASEGMLEVARGPHPPAPSPRGEGEITYPHPPAPSPRREGEIVYLHGDALALPFADGSFDAVTIAFGNRNVASLERLYAEMARVLRPGGRAASLEITPPDAPLMRALFFLYFGHAPALMARLLGSDPGAYRYLPDSVRTYPNAEAVVDIMRAAGLHEVRYERHLGGAITLHVGVR